MELTQLKYFLAAANCGQIVQAAEMMHISQSAISMAISRLEKELGVSLFEKKGRSIRLTKNGESFVTMITPAMAELDFAANQMLSADRIEPDTITLSVETPDFATTFECIYCALNPKARFRQGMDPTEITKQKLLCEKVDFTLSFEPIYDPDVSTLLLLQEPVLVQLSSAHPLFERESIRLSELADTPFASFSPEYSFRRWTDGMCFLAGFRPDVCFEVGDTQSMHHIVQHRNAATFVALSTWEEDTGEEGYVPSPDDPIRAIPLVDKHCQRSVYLSYNKNRILTSDSRSFLDYATQFKTAMERFGSLTKSREWLLSQ